MYETKSRQQEKKIDLLKKDKNWTYVKEEFNCFKIPLYCSNVLRFLKGWEMKKKLKEK